jgi:anti-sigma B factor antagonist
MLGMEQSTDDLQAAITGETVFVRVIGRGSFKVAAPLKQYLTDIIAKQSIKLVALDLKECIGMDSTFMGVLAGLSGRLKKSGQALELINLSEKNANLLSTLGVAQILDFYSNAHGHNIPEQEAASLPTDGASRKDMAETALQAHENLVEISEENHPRFKRVIELLREDVDRLN